MVGLIVGSVGNVLTIVVTGVVVWTASCALRVFAIIAVASVGMVGMVGNVWNVTNVDTIFLVGQVCNVGKVPKVNSVEGGVFNGIGASRGGKNPGNVSPPPITDWNTSKYT